MTVSFSYYALQMLHNEREQSITFLFTTQFIPEILITFLIMQISNHEIDHWNAWPIITAQ